MNVITFERPHVGGIVRAREVRGVLVSILKRKGGVGSSTLAASLAGEWAARRGRRVRLLDCDAQHSVATWASFADVPGVLAEVVQPVGDESPKAFRAELEAAKAAADVVLVDCAPGFPPTVTIAAQLADVVLVPCGPSPLDLAPAADALEVAALAVVDGRPALGLVPSRNVPRTRLGRELPEALEKIGAEHGARVLPGTTQRVAFAEAVLSGLTPCEYEPEGAAAAEVAELADAIEELAR